MLYIVITAMERMMAKGIALFTVMFMLVGCGAHVNISGAGITKASQSPENAKKLLEFLTSPNSQRWYAKVNNEYPVDPKVEASQILKSWGDFKSDSLPVGTLGKLNMEAVKSMDKAGWP